LISKVGNGESIAVKLKRFDALSPAALENSSEAVIPSNTYSMQAVVEEYRNQHQPTPFLRPLNATFIGAPSIGAYGEKCFLTKKYVLKTAA